MSIQTAEPYYPRQPQRRPATVQNQRRLIASWFPLLCAAIVLARLSYDRFELSYDYAFYARFINELSYTSVTDFLSNVSDNAPYYQIFIQQGNFNYALGFEFGFAALSFAMAQIMPVGAVLPVLAAGSIYAKMRALRDFGYSVPILAGLFVFFIALLETNALRAGMAQTVALVGFLMTMKSGRLLPLLIATILAATLHLSSLALTLGLCGGWIFFQRGGPDIQRFRFVAVSALAAGVLFSVPWITAIFSRAEVYVDAGSEETSFGLKMLPLLSVALSIFAVLCTERLIREWRARPHFVTKHIAMAAAVASVLVIFGTALYVFNTIPVISARVWQLIVPLGFLPCVLALRWRVLRPGERHLTLALVLLISGAFVYQFMFRYVLTNFFSPLIGHRALDLGQCVSGLCQ